MYLPVASTRNAGTRFLNPTERVTLTIPSTASKVIAVAAYHPVYDTYADFSGRGFIYPGNFQEDSNLGAVRPTLAAPGVDISAPRPRAGYGSFTGTSFATPFVTGAAALLLEWGIILGNDPFLYGEKLKAWLIRYARPLQGITEYPSDKVGFGALCVKNGLPG